MANATTSVTLEKQYKSLGYVKDKKQYLCPDCYAVNQKRAAKSSSNGLDLEFIHKISCTVIVFRKGGKPPVAACRCGFRKTEGKVQHGPAFTGEFDAYGGTSCTSDTHSAAHNTESNTAPAASPETKSRCTFTKRNGERCKNMTKDGSDRCHCHPRV